MKKLFLVLLSTMSLILVACGGGGSSSDSSSSDTFNGAKTIVLLGESSDSLFVMSIDGTTVIILDDDFTASGTLNGANFTVNVPPFSFIEDDITCEFDVTYNSSLVSETRVEGTISGSAFYF